MRTLNTFLGMSQGLRTGINNVFMCKHFVAS